MSFGSFQYLSQRNLTVTVSGRRFHIGPGDTTKVLCWLPGQSVEILEADDGAGAFYLVSGQDEIRGIELIRLPRPRRPPQTT